MADEAKAAASAGAARKARNRYWIRSRRLMLAMLLAWLILTFAMHFLVGLMNQVRFLGFPLGYFMVAQGSLILLLLLLVLFEWRQSAIDRQESRADR